VYVIAGRNAKGRSGTEIEIPEYASGQGLAPHIAGSKEKDPETVNAVVPSSSSIPMVTS